MDRLVAECEAYVNAYFEATIPVYIHHHGNHGVSWTGWKAINNRYVIVSKRVGWTFISTTSSEGLIDLMLEIILHMSQFPAEN